MWSQIHEIQLGWVIFDGKQDSGEKYSLFSPGKKLGINSKKGHFLDLSQNFSKPRS